MKTTNVPMDYYSRFNVTHRPFRTERELKGDYKPTKKEVFILQSMRWVCVSKTIVLS